MRTRFLAVLLVVCMVTFASASAFAQTLMVYGALHEWEVARILEAFRRETGIRTQFVRMSAGETVARIRAERAAPRADIFLGGPAESHAVLVLDNLLESYRPPTADEIDNRYHDPNGFWHGFYLGALGIAINKTRFEKELAPKGIALPKTWEDLLDPAYKGEITVANPNTSGTAYTFIVTHFLRLGEEKGWEFLEKFDQNVHHYTRSGAAPAQQAGTGEFLVGITFGHDILKPLVGGFPLTLVYPEDTGWEVGAVSIIKGGPNTELAKRFVDWMMGYNANQLHTDLSMRISTRTDVLVPPAVIPLTQLKLVDYDMEWATVNRDRLLAEWNRRFGR